MEKLRNNKDNPWIISYGRTDYNGQPINTLTPIHKAQQIHKYRLGLFITGIVALCAALADLILIAMFVAKGSTDQGVSAGITSASIIFVITLLVDIVFTVNLNRYIKEKRWLLLYIPCFVLMVLFSVPQIMTLLHLVISAIPDLKIENIQWANYVNIVVCLVFVVAEALRMYWHRNDLDIRQEMKKALK